MNLIWSCPEGAQSEQVVNGWFVPACAEGQGQWIEAPQPWWGYQLPGDQIGALLGAQLLFFAVVMVCRQVDKSIS